MKGRVTKCLSGVCEVKTPTGVFSCVLRGRLRAEKKSVLVGDNVVIDEKVLAVEDVLPRKNELLRPPIANVDQILVVIAPKPKPDFYLVDQVIINAAQNGVKAILVLNKKDMFNQTFVRDCKEQYDGVVGKMLETCFLDSDGIDKLKKLLKNKFTVLVGQSGVGKSTLLNAICGTHQETRKLSSKIERGVNTTRTSEVFEVDGGGQIVDTPGFSMLSLKTIQPNELASFYADINKYTRDCLYSSCNHIRKPSSECGVIRALERGRLNPKRYARYVELYNMYKMEWDKRYK